MDAKHLLFLLELFEGKLSINDVLYMELPLLLNLEKEKIEQIEKQARQTASMAKKAENKMGTVTNGTKNK